MRLRGKAVVITGSGRGIGEAYARGAAALGAAVVVNDIDFPQAQKVAADISALGGRAVAHGANIGVWEEAGDLIKCCIAEFGAIDGLINNAGVIRFGRLEEAKPEDVRAMVEANLIGTFNCAAHAIRHMYQVGRGAIVNVTSGAQVGMPELGGYGATKGGVASFTYTWAAEAAGTGVRVNAISPWAQTRMTDANTAHFAARGNVRALPMIATETNVPVALFLLSDLARDINGQVVRITGTKLSLMTHPAIRLPIMDADAWTVDSVAEAFKTTLAPLQLPPGLAVLDIASLKTLG
jgi:NAD(P)-dependent dehydrogenase (short-subunit alcohol dehydrogenase family)